MLHNEAEDTQRIREVLDAMANVPVIRRMRMRLREMEANVGDEVLQFRFLQRACREDAPLAAALAEAGFGDIAAMNPLKVAPKTGRVVQAFNAFLEQAGSNY